ncbi:MAG TPA: hypothetical protein VGF41_08960 [Myxococcaceae bacterium]
MRRQFSLLTGAILLACAGGQSSSAAAPTEQRQRVQNLTPFDIGTCFPGKVDMGKTANEYTLQAAFRAARPAVNECLTDAKVQNGTTATKGKAAMTIDASGTTVAVSGDGVQPAATGCIEKAIRAQLEGVTAPAGGKPFTLEAPFEREPNTMVRMGINEASDVEGTIRLAVPQWCSCFEPIKTLAPPSLSGMVTVTRVDPTKKSPDGGTLKAVTAAMQASEPAAAQVASCLNQKIEGLPLKSSSEQLIVPAQLFLLNSGGPASMPATVAPQVQFAQLDVVRERRQAEAFAALARRQSVANKYDGQVQAYQAAVSSKDAKKRKAAGGMVKDLKSGCAALVKADEEYTKALESEAAVEQEAVTLAQTLKAKDPSWADAEKASGGALAETQKQIDASKQLTTANQKACPKEKY